MANPALQPVLQQLEKTANILLVVGGAPTVDSLGSALALSLALHDLGKRVQVFTPNSVRVEHSRLVGCDKVENKLTAGKSFVISLPGAVDTIEKVSCYAEAKTLNIVLQPYADAREFNPADVQYSKASGTFDAMVLLDIPSRHEAQKYLGQQAALLSEIPVIALGKVGDPSSQTRFIDPQCPATAVIVMELLDALQVRITADIANNLMQAIYEASDDFHAPFVTPELFEVSAKLLKVVHGETGRMQSPVAPLGPQDDFLSTIPQPKSRLSRPPTFPRTPPPMPRPGGYQPNFAQGAMPATPQPGFGRANQAGGYANPLPPLPNFPKMPAQPLPKPPVLSPFGTPPQPYGQNPTPAPYNPFPQANTQQPANQFGANSRVGYGQNQPGNKIGTNQEWEIDPFFEIDKAPDEAFMPETMGTSMGTYGQSQAASAISNAQKPQARVPQRESYQSQTSPTAARPGDSQASNRKQNQGRPQNSGQQTKNPKNTQNPKNNQEDDWTQPKIYRTEDLL